MRDFLGRLYNLPVLPSKKNYNLLLFGLAGATKSSFLNSVYTLLSDSPHIVQIAGAGGLSRHNTIRLEKYELEGTRITIWDTWGLTQSNYKNEQLEQILEGNVPDGWGMSDDFSNIVKLSGENKISGVLVFVPQSVIEDPNQQTARDLIGNNLKTIAALGVTPHILLSKVDEVEPEIRISTLGVSSPILTTLKEKAKSIFKVSDEHISFVVNYMEERKRCVNIDKLTYSILNNIANIICRREHNVNTVAETREELNKKNLQIYSLCYQKNIEKCQNIAAIKKQFELH